MTPLPLTTIGLKTTKLLLITAAATFWSSPLSGDAFGVGYNSVSSSRSVGNPSRPSPSQHDSTRLFQSKKADNNLRPPKKIDVRMFLTQRCIQSFMVLLASVHDVHTLNWLDDFTQPINFCFRDTYEEESDVPSNAVEEGRTWLENDKRLTNSRLLSYHGTDAMNTTRFPTWESYFLDLVESPPKTLTIQTNRLVKFVNGLSEFDVDIDPPRLCSRLISVREQIAREWVRDLEAIGAVGLDIFCSYWETVKDGNNGKPSQAFERQSKLFLEEDVVAPSPFRKVNYDLLYNLATQESIHRVLKQGISVEQDSDGIASTEFLRRFYYERAQSHFNDGISFGRADDFIDELMQCTPRIQSTASSSSEMVIVNPVTIAEVILKTREKVAKDWQEIMKHVPHEHADIRKLTLEKIMAQ